MLLDTLQTLPDTAITAATELRALPHHQRINLTAGGVKERLQLPIKDLVFPLPCHAVLILCGLFGEELNSQGQSIDMMGNFEDSSNFIEPDNGQ